jgi:hypothetical protein
MSSIVQKGEEGGEEEKKNLQRPSKKNWKNKDETKKNSLLHLEEEKMMYYGFLFCFFVSIISMLKRRNKNNNLVDHCCTATYIHKSISLHHTIDKTDNMSLHINKNTLKKKENIYTYRYKNDRLSVRKNEKNYLKKYTYSKLVCSNA